MTMMKGVSQKGMVGFSGRKEGRAIKEDKERESKKKVITNSVQGLGRSGEWDDRCRSKSVV